MRKLHDPVASPFQIKSILNYKQLLKCYIVCIRFFLENSLAPGRKFQRIRIPGTEQQPFLNFRVYSHRENSRYEVSHASHHQQTETSANGVPVRRGKQLRPFISKPASIYNTKSKFFLINRGTRSCLTRFLL